ncbi:MAG: sigma-54-dependent Fis family transcriptional regulator [Myxococcales bacterium]|nr:sigma-54-dependent Fis family transcriptional regulator [Myxococcales bacterium]
MRILVVDDELSMREYLEILLTRAGYQVEAADSVGKARAAIEAGRVDLIVSDMKLGGDSGMSVLRAARAAPSPPEVILITAYGTPESAVQAMREGAYDYLRKPIDNEELKALVQKALEKREIVRENQALRSSLAPGVGRFLLGTSPSMRAVWTLVEKVAASPRSTVLITGESGTGKELVARAIHWKSARSGQPFIPFNCAALAEGVLESELFGHVKGAFTGATSDRAGLLVAAGEGTVVLDEIGEIPLSTQVKLLRILQARMVKPVGSSSEVPFQARVLAATNKRLDEEVKAGRFREDLLYRLNVITIELPPLRERPEDIAALAKMFLAQLAGDLGRPALNFEEETLALLQRYLWPGNVRQLQNIVERAATLSDSDRLGPDSLPPALRGEVDTHSGGEEPQLVAGFSLERFLDSQERRYLMHALRRAEGVKTRAAELLGLSFRSFRYRLAKHGLSDREEPN